MWHSVGGAYSGCGNVWVEYIVGVHTHHMSDFLPYDCPLMISGDIQNGVPLVEWKASLKSCRG